MQGIIIGGGIGGLCAAIALKQRGFEVRVYESAPELKPVGAGILVAPNAMNILQRLGLAQEIVEAGIALEQMNLLDKTGMVLQSVSEKEINRSAIPTVAILRNRLHRVLLGHIDPSAIELAKHCDSFAEESDRIRVLFNDGTEAEGSFLIGADGIASVIRTRLFPTARLRYSGQTCWRGVADLVSPKERQKSSTECWGEGLRFGFLPVDDKHVYWYATQKVPPGGKDKRRELKDKLLGMYRAFPNLVPDLIRATPERSITRHDLYDLRRLKRWSTRRVTLLGDAAHATTPNLGQGGAQAIEDGWVLADCLDTHGDTGVAFREYEQKRMRKTRMIVSRSWQFGKLASIENPMGCAIRNLVIRGTPRFVTIRQFGSIYELDY